MNIITLISGVAILLSGCANQSLNAVRGLGFFGQDGSLLAASSAGASIYTKGYWTNAEIIKSGHVYAINTVDGGLYASIIRSDSSQRGIPQTEIVYGSSHQGVPTYWQPVKTITSPQLMAVSYFTHTLYVWNHKDGNESNASGLFYSKDNGGHWKKTEAHGFNSTPQSIAIHPADDAIVALGNSDGLWLSRDYGMHFYRVYSGIHITSLFFGQAGGLFVTGEEGQEKPFLIKYDYNLNSKSELALPLQLHEKVSYFTENLVNMEDMAIATDHQGIYLSRNKGENWFLVRN